MVGCMGLASFVAQVKRSSFTAFSRSAAGTACGTAEQSHNVYDNNCVEVKLLPGRQLLGYLEAVLAALSLPTHVSCTL